VNLVFGIGIEVPGVVVPCPELAIAKWYDGGVSPIAESAKLSDDFDITARTVDDEGGEARIVAGLVTGLVPALQVTMAIEGIWDVVLVDSFEDSICPGVDPSESAGEALRFFFGQLGSIVRLNRGNLDRDERIHATLKPNVVAPAGPSARCLFRNVYLAVEGNTGGGILFTPIVDGEVLTEEALLFAVPSDGVTKAIKRFEIPLTQMHTYNRQGLVGTWFSFLLEAVDVYGCGRMSISGWELEYEVLAESLPGQAFTGEAYVDPDAASPLRWFVGGVGSGVSRGGVGTTDGGVAIPVRLVGNEVAPAGVGGEALFQNVYLVVIRRNTEDWAFTFTPIVDGEAMAAITVTLAGVEDMVSEVVELSLAQTGAVTYHPRGAWFGYRITAALAPDKPVEFHGLELEYEIVTESLKDVTNV
jgi:hypothetical protein